jgi:hypothetical protein
VACDVFTVPTVTCRVLFVFIMLAHERRRIVHLNVTEHPTAQWTAQQIVEAFPWETAPGYLLRDRDTIYSAAFQSQVKNLGIEEVKRSPLDHLGRILSRSRSSAAFGETPSIISSCSMNTIYAVCFNLMSTTTTIGARIDHWQWMHQSRERFSHLIWVRSESCRKSAVCITTMSDKPRE